MKWGGKNKFGARKVVYQGITFDSTYERDRYIYLCQLQKEGKISGLRRQVRFILIPKTKVKYEERCVELASVYHNDFLYVEDGKYITEEFKSQMTSTLPDYVLRRKLMVKKIYEHNAKGRSQWVFREVVYYRKSKIIIIDK